MKKNLGEEIRSQRSAERNADSPTGSVSSLDSGSLSSWDRQQISDGEIPASNGVISQDNPANSPFFCHTCNLPFQKQEELFSHLQSPSHKVTMSKMRKVYTMEAKAIEAKIKASPKYHFTKRRFCIICKTYVNLPLAIHRKDPKHKENEMLSQEQQRENGGINFDNLGNDEDDDENDEDDDEDDDDDNQEMHPVLTRSLPASARGGGGGRGRGGRGSGRGQGGGGGRGGGAGVMTISLSNNQKMAFKNSTDATSREVEADVAVSPSLTSGPFSTTSSTVSSALGASGVGSRSLTVFNSAAPSSVNLQQRAQDEEGRGECKPQGQEFVVPIMGFFCKLCLKFYTNQNSATIKHCCSQQHVTNYKKHLTAQQEDSSLMQQMEEAERPAITSADGRLEDQQSITETSNQQKDVE